MGDLSAEQLDTLVDATEMASNLGQATPLAAPNIRILIEMARRTLAAEQRQRDLEAAATKADLELQSALSALGTGRCRVNGCKGCKADAEAARGSIEAARALLPPEAAPEPREHTEEGGVFAQ